jgi:hypothetical protein
MVAASAARASGARTDWAVAGIQLPTSRPTTSSAQTLVCSDWEVKKRMVGCVVMTITVDGIDW